MIINNVPNTDIVCIYSQDPVFREAWGKVNLEQKDWRTGTFIF